MVWVVKQMNNLTAYDNFNEDTFQGETCVTEEVFEFKTFDEAEEFHRQKKAMLRFAGGPGMFYSYPSELDKNELAQLKRRVRAR